MKIILTGDIFFHSIGHLAKVSLYVQQAFLPMIKDAVGNNIEITFNIENNSSEMFSREHFYELGNMKNPKYNYQEYNIEQFNQSQIDYLKQFFNKDTIIISFELYEKVIKLLSSFGCTIVDLAHHPYKLLDDLPFGICTNNKDIYNKLLKYQIPKEKFYYYANYWKVFMEQNNMVQDKDICENSALFIGQTLKDKSVERNGIFLNVTNYEEKLKELSKQYSKVYYLPHPYLGRHRKMIYDWVKKSPYIDLITNRLTYGLLVSAKIKKVVGISTSVLYEAQYFDKEIEYLYKPLFNIDTTFEDYSYTSVLDDYWCPKFWSDILAPVCEVNKNVSEVNFFKPCHNKFRNLQDLYWSYAQLDPIKRIPNLEQSIRNVYLKYIAPLF